MYIPLHITTDYTILKSLIKVKDLVNFCVKNNIKNCAICDENMYGVMEFYKLAKSNKIKPIIGLDITLLNKHLYLYAENYLGYKNLLKINTIISERNITVHELENYSDNVLLIIPYDSLDIAKEVGFFKDIYYGYENKEELQNLRVKSDKVVFVHNINTFKLADNKYLPYLDKLRESEVVKYTHNYFDFDLSEFDLKKLEEVNNLLNLEMPQNERYIPKYKEGEDSFNYLYNLCVKGLKKRCNNIITKEYSERLKYELSVIKKMGFVDYFLIVYDYVLYAKKNGILVGPGRGSAAGSLVSYVIGITDIDPIKYNLLFERFLNYERVTMPDIDIDFDSTKRDDVINYVKNKYGEDQVSGGLTYATLKTRLVLRDIGKIIKVDETLLNKFLKVIDRDLTLKDNLQKKEVKLYLERYPEIKKLYEVSYHLEGLKKNFSTHAAGIVIASKPLDEIIPMYKNGDVYLCGVPMEYLEEIGLLKMDFLALSNLNLISHIISQIPGFNLSKIPLDDSEVYKLFCNSDTDGIFQFNTYAFKSMLKKYKPQNFLELVASIALVRPGPSQELATYIKRKNGQEKITYFTDSLKDILKETYGVIVYQEQVISILVKMASFSYAEADNIRRAMAKKKEDIIIKEKDNFIKRSMQNGYDKSLAEDIFNHILKFASYGFNKAHSVSYALVSYQMAYLKVHYRSLFTFELLDSALGNSEKIKNYLTDLKKEHLQISPVRINYSEERFILRNKTVILPFKMIKNIKTDVVKQIMSERSKGLFTNVFDFFERTCEFMKENDYLTLINAGALQEFGISTHTLIENLEEYLNYGSLRKDLGEYALKPSVKEYLEYDKNILREKELNSYGFYISNHPASKYTDKMVMKLEKINDYLFKNCICYVMIDNISKIKTKDKEDMAFIEASDDTGKCEFVVFPKYFYLLQNLAKNDMIKVWGKVSKRYDKINVLISNVVKDE